MENPQRICSVSALQKRRREVTATACPSAFSHIK
jgi:hypothetical protein